MIISTNANGISGLFICPNPDTPSCTIERDVRLVVDDAGTIVERRSCDEAEPNNMVWLPGFVDTHVHYPQHRVRGRSSGQLLPWLEQTVFPEEARFVDLEYATTVAGEFCDALLKHGTTCAQVFGSSDELATYALFATLKKVGLRAQVGMTLMDKNAPPELCVPPAAAEKAIRRLVKKWHGADNDRLRFVITPRFALSCSDELLTLAGSLSQELNLSVQTHLSENVDEIAAVAAAFPESPDYLGVYEHYNLAHNETIFAHCIHLSEHEWDRMESRNCAVSHCPDSNFFLGSGQFPWQVANTRKVRIGLGSDVGAGRTYAIQRIAASAYDTAFGQQQRQTPSALIWYATRGGALAINRGNIGCLEPGFECDLIGIHIEDAHLLSEDALLDRILFQTDRLDVRAVYVRGRLIHDANSG